jgi:hypothetical protein
VKTPERPTTKKRRETRRLEDVVLCRGPIRGVLAVFINGQRVRGVVRIVADRPPRRSPSVIDLRLYGDFIFEDTRYGKAEPMREGTRVVVEL